MGGDTQVPANHVDKERIALGGPDRGSMADGPQQETRDPEPQSKPQRCGQGPVEDRHRARRASEQNWFRQSPVDRDEKASDGVVHQITTPPPKEKNDRKKLEAANAIERPNTIWTNRRKPPDVSPKASERPVTMMTITAMIFATGPSTDWRI